MSRPRSISIMLTVAIMLLAAVPMALAQGGDEVRLTILTHWGEELQIEKWQSFIDEYTASHPNVTIELQTVPFNELLTKIVTARTAGTSPDIYHIYNLWLPEFVNSGMLAVPPDDVVEDIANNAVTTSIAGVTVNDQIWGYPTEVKTGAVTQVGFGVITGWDSGVVHPFMALLFSNGGQYFNDDYTEVAFGNEQGLETLQLYADLLESGGMDLSVPWGDFVNGNIGMIIMANWWRATIMASENIDYETEVGVAPIPVGPSGTETATLAYNWLFAVDAHSPNQEAAWEFVRWLNTPPAEGEPSPSGDFVVNNLGAIPSLVFDQEAFAEDMGDHFLAPFVASTEYAIQEPVIGGSQEIKTMLQTEIESLWTGMTDPQSVLDYVVPEANAILDEFRMATEG